MVRLKFFSQVFRFFIFYKKKKDILHSPGPSRPPHSSDSSFRPCGGRREHDQCEENPSSHYTALCPACQPSSHQRAGLNAPAQGKEGQPDCLRLRALSTIVEGNEEWDRGRPRGCALGSKVTAALLATTEFFHPTILQSTKGELGMERKKKKLQTSQGQSC